MKINSKINVFINSASLSLMLLLQGCGTMTTHMSSNVPYDYDHGCFRGTTYDAHWFTGNSTWLYNASDDQFATQDDWFITIWFGAPMMTCDLALSICTDVVFLPYDGIKVWSEAPPAPEKRLEDTQTYHKALEQK
jgi:uncharacterized protein YceK